MTTHDPIPGPRSDRVRGPAGGGRRAAGVPAGRPSFPAHDRVRLTERERVQFARLQHGHVGAAGGPPPAPMVATGLLVLVAGSVAVSPAALFAGIGLVLAGLGRALRSGPHVGPRPTDPGVDAYFDTR